MQRELSAGRLTEGLFYNDVDSIPVRHIEICLTVLLYRYTILEIPQCIVYVV